MTREEAIKMLEYLATDTTGTLAGYSGDYAEFLVRVIDSLDMAIAALREQESAKNAHCNCCKNGNSSWISVEDEKPKRRGRYFIAYKFAGSDMHFYGEAIWHDDIPDNGYVRGDHFSNEGVDGMYVTHWMDIPKLPEPPEVEG